MAIFVVYRWFRLEQDEGVVDCISISQGRVNELFRTTIVISNFRDADNLVLFGAR